MTKGSLLIITSYNSLLCTFTTVVCAEICGKIRTTLNNILFEIIILKKTYVNGKSQGRRGRALKHFRNGNRPKLI